MKLENENLNEPQKPQLNIPAVSCSVVHCKKAPYDVYIGRPSKWGNPFVVGRDGNREEVVKKYHDWILTQPQLLKDLHELEGKVLACWCAPKACHGDVLEKLAKEYNNV